jgi:hypothetical protein
MESNRLCTTAISSRAPTCSLWKVTASVTGAVTMVIRKTTTAGKNAASSHHEGRPNRITPGPKTHARIAPTVGASMTPSTNLSSSASPPLSSGCVTRRTPT